MRKKFEKELNEMENKTIEMISLAQSSLIDTINYLKYKDEELLTNIHKYEEASDHIEKELQNMIAKMIITWQPVAKDLRFISSVMKLISDLERINDQCVDICELHINNLTINDIIISMANICNEMLKDDLKAFIYKDQSLAKTIKAKDDLIDRYFEDYRNQLIDVLKDSKTIEYHLNELMIAKYFERIGDHSVNISEWVLYYLGGEQ